MIARVLLVWKDALPMLFALLDRRTPIQAKVLAALAIAYAVAPTDLLPDLSPFLGIADDILIVPTLLGLAASTLPPAVLAEARSRSYSIQRRMPLLVPAVVAVCLVGISVSIWGLGKLLGLGH